METQLYYGRKWSQALSGGLVKTTAVYDRIFSLTALFSNARQFCLVLSRKKISVPKTKLVLTVSSERLPTSPALVKKKKYNGKSLVVEFKQ